MTKFSKTIINLESKLKKIDSNNSNNRVEIINKSLNKFILPKLFNQNEIIYVHTKLHMIYTFKNLSDNKGKIKVMHDKIKLILLNHINTDTLDE